MNMNMNIGSPSLNFFSCQDARAEHSNQSKASSQSKLHMVIRRDLYWWDTIDHA